MKAYQVKIMIKNSKPPIWRRAIIPAGLSFSQLQLVFNEIMGWCGGHLSMFEFRTLGIRIEEPFDDVLDKYSLDAREEIIDEYFEKVDWFSYVYDFGDWWDHRVTVEKVLENYPYNYPKVLKLKGDTPPENCGGIEGYYELQETLSNPEDPYYGQMSDWMEMMNPIQYEVEELNDMLECLYITDEVHLPMGKEELYEAFWDGEPLKRIVSEEKWQNNCLNGKGESSNLEKWKALYEVADRVKKLEPWKDFCDIDVIAIRTEKMKEPAYFSIMGNAGDCYGICVYEGNVALNQLMMVVCQEQVNASRELLAYKQTALACYWGNREELTKEQYNRIKELGYKYRGKNQWQYFKSFVEGFFPWDLNQDEVERMTYYMGLLEKVLLSCKEELMQVNFENDKIAYVNAAAPNNLFVEEIDFPVEAKAIPSLRITDELLITKLKKLAKKKHSDVCLEAELIIPMVDFKDASYSRSVSVAICVLVDANTGLVLKNEMVGPGEDAFITMADIVVDYILTEAVPKEIQVSNAIMAATLDNICENAGIKLVPKLRLKETARFAGGLKNRLRSR